MTQLCNFTVYILNLLFHGTFQMQVSHASQVYSKVIADTKNVLGTAIFLGKKFLDTFFSSSVIQLGMYTEE